MSSDSFTIAEVSRLTGLAPYTLRYYEQCFPSLLNPERSKGGHRVYHSADLEALHSIVHCLKDEKMTIRQAKLHLCEGGEADEKEPVHVNSAAFDDSVMHNDLYSIDGSHKSSSSEVSNLTAIMVKVLERLDSICRNGISRDKMLMRLVESQEELNQKNELLEQIDRCRKESRETARLCRNLLNGGSQYN